MKNSMNLPFLQKIQTQGKTVVAFDTETHLISAERVSPPVICVSLAYRETEDHVESVLLAGHRQDTEDTLRGLLMDDNIILVGHQTCYDLGVIHTSYPSLTELVWEKLRKGLVTDTKIRETLLNLSILGGIDSVFTPDGGSYRLGYSLNDLGKIYLGVDRSEEKEGEDIWRLRYGELEGMEIEDYPPEAHGYALDDAVETLMVYEAQEERCTAERGPGSMNTHEFQTAVHYALRRMTMKGVAIDQEARDAKADELAELLSERNLPLLIESGILRPAQPSRPAANQLRRVQQFYGKPVTKEDLATQDFSEDLEALSEAGIKITKPKAASVNKAKLTEQIEKVCEEQGIELRHTDSGRVSTSAGFLQEIAPFDEILTQYQDRQALVRLAGTELPRLAAPRVYPNFEILKETGRTSSRGNAKKTVMEPYPSTNIQQVDPRARNVFVPDPGFVFCSVDYSTLELASVAQTTYSLFGESAHRDKILAGYDLHAYLGAQLAFNLDSGFAQTCADCTSADEVYHRFLETKKTNLVFFKHWRKFAKPTGLGFPGGLGVNTFITFAAATYGVQVDVDTAKRLKEIWLATYPEMVAYFNWINTECVDPQDPTLYCYETPLKMWRSSATYCAAANGRAMQSPSAEGAKLAVFETMRACDAPAHALHGCFPWAFIHDEIILQIPEDERMTERALAVSKIMVDSMGYIFPDVPVKAEPALMRMWDKGADTIYNKSGELQIWSPEEEK